MVDKFTKWIEAKPVKTAQSGPVIDFISEVVHCYGVPHNIITENGSNFTADEVKTWCGNMGIKLDYASVYHPQTNGQVERANGLIMRGIKPRLVRSLKESDTGPLGGGARLRTMGAVDHAESHYRIHTVFYGVRCRGSTAMRHNP